MRNDVVTLTYLTPGNIVADLQAAPRIVVPSGAQNFVLALTQFDDATNNYVAPIPGNDIVVGYFLDNNPATLPYALTSPGNFAINGIGVFWPVQPMWMAIGYQGGAPVAYTPRAALGWFTRP